LPPTETAAESAAEAGRRQQRLSRRLAIALAIAVLIAAVWLLAHRALVPGGFVGAGDSPFTSATWKGARGNSASLRYDMVRSLVKGRQLKGLSRAEVLGLLGPPDGAVVASRLWGGAADDQQLATQASEYWFDLGVPGERAWWSLTKTRCWLILEFGASGGVSRWRGHDDSTAPTTLPRRTQPAAVTR